MSKFRRYLRAMIDFRYVNSTDTRTVGRVFLAIGAVLGAAIGGLWLHGVEGIRGAFVGAPFGAIIGSMIAWGVLRVFSTFGTALVSVPIGILIAIAAVIVMGRLILRL